MPLPPDANVSGTEVFVVPRALKHGSAHGLQPLLRSGACPVPPRFHSLFGNRQTLNGGL